MYPTTIVEALLRERGFYESAGDKRRVAEVDVQLAHYGVGVETATPKAATIDAIKAEVGDDPELAAEALEAELAHEKPRKSLVSYLEALIEETAQDSVDDTPRVVEGELEDA